MFSCFIALLQWTGDEANPLYAWFLSDSFTSHSPCISIPYISLPFDHVISLRDSELVEQFMYPICELYELDLSGFSLHVNNYTKYTQ